MAFAIRSSSTSDDDERRLEYFGLSTDLVHTAMRPGMSRAANRSSMALPSTPGTDIYHDAMEQFHLMLADTWRLVYVDQQPRLVHPDDLLCFTVASGINVASADPRQQPRSRKGNATREALSPLAEPMDALFEVVGARTAGPTHGVTEAPLWLLLHERSDHGLNLELARPAEPMTPSGVVTYWHDRIRIGFLHLDGDLSVFDDGPDDNGPIDVAVEPR